MKFFNLIFFSLFFSIFFIFSTHAENVQECKMTDLLNFLSYDLNTFEKVEKKILGKSSEGANVEYYYSGSELKAVKAIYYGETSKTEIEYFFKTQSNYVSILSDYYYSAPIYMADSKVVSSSISKFIVCNDELMRGIGDNIIVSRFERASKALDGILESESEK